MRTVSEEMANPSMESGSDAVYYTQHTYDEGPSDLDTGFVETNLDCSDPLFILMCKRGERGAAAEHAAQLRGSTDQFITQKVIEQAWKHSDEIAEQKFGLAKFAEMQRRIRLIKAQKGASK